MSPSTLRLSAVSFVCAALLWFPAFRSLQATGFGDWQYFHHMWEAGYVAFTRHGEWPLWDPYHCGGITIFGNPQSQSMSPVYLVALLLGPTPGSKLFVVLHAWGGFAGMYVLARRHGLSSVGSLLASIAWAASGFFASHGSVGHAWALPFYLTPWVLLAWRASATDPRHAVSVAGLLVLVLLEGGVYPFPYLMLLLAFDALLRLTDRAHARGILLSASVVGLLTAFGGAIRLLPIVDELRRSPRTMPSQDSVSLAEVLEMLTARRHAWSYEGHEFGWHEYTMYVGWGVLALAALGSFSSARSRRWRVGLGALVFLAFTMGDHGVLSAWSAVHRLPVYDSLRVPSRFAVFFTLYLGLLAGAGSDALHRRWSASPLAQRSPRLALLTHLITLFIFVDLLIVHFPTINRWADPPVITDATSDHFFLSTDAYGPLLASLPRMNLGSSGCYEGMSFTPAAGLWSGDQPQARVLTGSGELLRFSRTNNRAFLDVRMGEPGRLLVNQNYAPGFQTTVGQVVVQEGMLALDLPAGEHHVALSYRPATLLPGLAASALGVLLALLWLRFGRQVAAPIQA